MDKLIAAKSEPLWNTNNKVISIIVGLVVLLFVLPLVGLNSFYLHLFIMIFMHAVMAQSWNVIAGFSGQISLGHGAFFGRAPKSDGNRAGNQNITFSITAEAEIGPRPERDRSEAGDAGRRHV